jgi:hypothetical protein
VQDACVVENHAIARIQFERHLQLRLVGELGEAAVRGVEGNDFSVGLPEWLHVAIAEADLADPTHCVHVNQGPVGQQLGLSVAERVRNRRAGQDIKGLRILLPQQRGDLEAVNQTALAALGGVR